MQNKSIIIKYYCNLSIIYRNDFDNVDVTFVFKLKHYAFLTFIYRTQAYNIIFL